MKRIEKSTDRELSPDEDVSAKLYRLVIKSSGGEEIEGKWQAGVRPAFRPALTTAPKLTAKTRASLTPTTTTATV